MRKAFKWLIGLSGGLAVLVVSAVFIVPRFVDVQKFKTELESRIQEAVGRPVKLDGDVRLSVFPWTALQLSEVHVGNPAGFEERDFVYMKSFELRIKSLPLLRGDIQVLSLSLEKPQIVLERNKNGLGNWEGARGKTEAHQPSRASHGLNGIMVEKMSLDGGTILYIDHASGMRREISDVRFHLKNVSLDRPFDIAFSAKVEGKSEPIPVSLKGSAGPLGNEPGRGIMPFDLTFGGPDQLELKVKGSLTDPAVDPKFDMVVRLSHFSPRKVLAALGRTDLPPPRALEKMAFDTRVTGGGDVVTLADGKLDLDDSHAVFSAVLKRVSGTDLTFTVKLDGIDLDRYLPPAVEEDPKARSQPRIYDADGAPRAKGVSVSADGIEAVSASGSKGTGNSVPGQIRLNGTVEIGKFKAHGVQTQDMRFSIQGENGVYKFDPMDLKLYQGAVSGRATVDMRRDIPQSEISFQATGVQVGPLLHDLMKKEPLTGTMRAKVAIRMEGGRVEQIERTLSGTGDIYVRQGAIRGVSLASVVKKVDSVIGLGGGASPQTDFSELHFPFTLKGGNLDTRNATLVSSHLTARASGNANLTRQTLDFRIEPKIAAPLKSLGISQIGANPEITVPVHVTGTFSSPEFVPDMNGAVQEAVKGGVQKLYKQGGTGSLGEAAKGLIKIPSF